MCLEGGSCGLRMLCRSVEKWQDALSAVVGIVSACYKLAH